MRNYYIKIFSDSKRFRLHQDLARCFFFPSFISIDMIFFFSLFSILINCFCSMFVPSFTCYSKSFTCYFSYSGRIHTTTFFLFLFHHLFYHPIYFFDPSRFCLFFFHNFFLSFFGEYLLYIFYSCYLFLYLSPFISSNIRFRFSSFFSSHRECSNIEKRFSVLSMTY